MEDDWTSPWADADDRGPTEVITILDAKDAKGARSAGSAGIDVPQPQIPNINVAVHDDPWSIEEPEDASAWAISSPAVGSGVVSGVIGGSRLSEWVEPASVGVPGFGVKEITEEKAELPNASGDAVKQLEVKNGGDWFGATNETDAWAAASDWGDIKQEEANKPNLSRESPPGAISEIKPLPSLDKLIDVNEEGLVHVDNQSFSIGASDNKQVNIEIETRGKEKTIAPDIIPIEASLAPETASTTDLAPTIEKEPKEGSDNIQEETKDEDEEDDDDDFGEFTGEGDFEDAEETPLKDTLEGLPPLPQMPHFKVDTPFEIDTSLLKKLYPIFTSYPEPPPIREIIYTTNSRKAWYRLSQSGTIRKEKSGDDDYVRVTWVGSKIQEDVNKIVSRWMAEDKSSGGGVALGGSQRLGAMFGWGEGVEPVEKKALPQWNTVKTHSRHSSLVVGKTTAQGFTKAPFDISTTKTALAESQTAPSSPLAASFGWSSFDNSQPTIESNPNSSSNSVKGDEKLPSTPYRASFHGTPSRMSSQPVTPSRSVVSHSPVVSNHSSKPSHSLATTRPSSPSPQSTQRTAEATATTPIIPASMDSLFSSSPGISMSREQSKSDSVPVSSSNFDEWGAFENIATTVKLPSSVEANCNFDEWGSLEGPKKATESKPATSVSVQGQIPSPLQPVGTPEVTKQAIGLSEDNGWGIMPVEPLQTAKDSISGGLSQKLSAASELKLPGLEGQEIDGWGSKPAFASPSVPKPSLGQTLAQPSTKATGELQPKSFGDSSLNSQKTYDWGSFDTFESAISAKPSTSTLKPTRISEEPSRKTTDASGPKTSVADNWGDPTLTSKPKIPHQPLRISPTHSIHSRTGSIGMTQPKAQDIDPLGSFDAFGVSKPSEVSKPFGVSKPKATNSLPRLEPRSSGSGRIITTSHVIPTISKLAVNDDDDDDDWGEMVQSPVVPKGSSPFSSALPSPLNPGSRTISPAPFPNTLPQPKAPMAPSAQSTASMFDFSAFEKPPAPQKPSSNNTTSNGNGGSDTWDLSFFDGSVSTTAATPTNVSAPMPFSNQVTTNTTATTDATDLWDAPPPTVAGRRENAKEAEESRLVNGILDGLPDLSYMLQ